MKNNFFYHTRHIPEEHLDFSVPMGKGVRENGLCDVLEPENIKLLKEFGIDTVELRLVWWELEPKPGVFDWSRFDRDLERVEAAGLKPGLFAWFNHPPEWYLTDNDSAVRFKCLEHDRETKTLSIWDPKTADVFERLYKIIAERYRGRLDFIYAAFSGDYGEPVLPQGVKHYRFSSPHSHPGIFWSGDKYARLSWKNYLQEKYNSINELNSAWGTAFGSFSADLLEGITDFQNVNTTRRLDYMKWLTMSVSNFAVKIFDTINRTFPGIRKGAPFGHCTESNHGQHKGLCIRNLSTVDKSFTVRWTGMAQLGEFSKSNVLAARIASAARFYGLGFGEEAALKIGADNAAAAFYEGLANGMSMLHNDIGNIKRSDDTNNCFPENYQISSPKNTVALFYPCEDEMVKAFEPDYENWLADYFQQAANLRHCTNYDICDHVMIEDGFLSNVENLVFVCDSLVSEATVEKLEEFINNDGKITVCNNAKITIIESGISLCEKISAVETIAGFPEYPAYEALNRLPEEFVTKHEDFVSRFNPHSRKIEISQQ